MKARSTADRTQLRGFIKCFHVLFAGIMKIFRAKLDWFKGLRAFTTNDVKQVKPFEDIPGPKGFLGLGTLLFNYLPVIGNYSWDAMHESCMKKYLQYGPIVRERLLPGINLLFVFNAEDIAKIMTSNGPGNYPERKSHLGLLEYRKDKPEVYRTGGLLPTNGDEWWGVRCEVQKGLSSPMNVRNFLKYADRITMEFLHGLIQDRAYPDLLPDIERLNLELICHMAFDARMDSFHEDERDDPGSRSNRLIAAAKASNSAILPLDQSFLWRLLTTPTYRRLKKSQQYIEEVAINLVSEKISYYHEEDSDGIKSLLDGYMVNPNLNYQDIIGMSCDLLLAGVDTSSYATAFALYHLGMNLDVQEKVYHEAIKILPDADEPIKANDFIKAVYTKAVLKESLRLNPIAIGVGRILTTDTVLSGYLVPKGTVTVVQTQVPSILENNFPNADKFIPERWLRDDTDKKPPINPFLSLPFGHGMRSCIARHFAEQNITLLLLRLIRKYEIKWTGDPVMTYSTNLINIPNQPVCLTLTKRE